MTIVRASSDYLSSPEVGSRDRLARIGPEAHRVDRSNDSVRIYQGRSSAQRQVLAFHVRRHRPAVRVRDERRPRRYTLSTLWIISAV